MSSSSDEKFAEFAPLLSERSISVRIGSTRPLRLVFLGCATSSVDGAVLIGDLGGLAKEASFFGDCIGSVPKGGSIALLRSWMLNFDLGTFRSFASIDIGVTGSELTSGTTVEVCRAESLKVEIGIDALLMLTSGVVTEVR